MATDGEIQEVVTGTTKTILADGWIKIYFAVPRAVEQAGQEFHMKLRLNGKNAEAFLEELNKLGVNTESLSKARKMDRKLLETDYIPNFMG